MYCPLYTGSNYIHYSLNEKLKLSSIESELSYTYALQGRFGCTCRAQVWLYMYVVNEYQHKEYH
jgi:hypothetical protein